jgi:hypothetical protein
MARYKITTIIDVHDKVTDKEYEKKVRRRRNTVLGKRFPNMEVQATSNTERLQVDYVAEIEELLEKDGMDLEWQPITFEIVSCEKLGEV